METKDKKYLILTYGCQMNVHESEKLAGILENLGYKPTNTAIDADVVVLTSYAPLFARIGYVQWSPDMIWFDDKSAYGTPSYYVQKLFATCTGDNVVNSALDGGEAEGIFHVVSEDEKYLYIKVVNTSEEEKCVTTSLTGEAKQITITGDWYEANSIAEPRKVAEAESTAMMDKLVLKPYSVNVYIVEK